MRPARRSRFPDTPAPAVPSTASAPSRGASPAAPGRAAVAALAALAVAGCRPAVAPGTATSRAPAPRTAAAACTFANPLFRGADPSVVFRDGVYYSVQSTGRGITVFRSDRLTDLNRNPVRVWAAPDTGWNRTNVWAPELQFINGRWYIYYAAGRTNPGEFFTTQRSGVLESATADPQGRWVDRGQLYTGDDVAGRTNNRWAIDLTVERVNGQLYAFWSGWEGDAPNDKTQNQNLYAARMANPYTIATNRVRISAPDQPWEDNPPDVGFDLQEGPTVLRNGPHTFIVYSTRESWMPTYRLGYLRLADSTNVLSPASYTKSPGPIFVATDGVYGVGHNTFTVSPDGREHWNVYHAKTVTKGGWDDRVVRMQPFSWNADGSPNLGTPVATGRRLPVPSGEPCAR
jgi:GH43 family beta-xylosidase